MNDRGKGGFHGYSRVEEEEAEGPIFFHEFSREYALVEKNSSFDQE
jgi:hypothetical protein